MKVEFRSINLISLVPENKAEELIANMWWMNHSARMLGSCHKDNRCTSVEIIFEARDETAQTTPTGLATASKSIVLRFPDIEVDEDSVIAKVTVTREQIREYIESLAVDPFTVVFVNREDATY